MFFFSGLTTTGAPSYQCSFESIWFMDGVDKGGTLQIASTECHYARICYLRKKNGKTKAGTGYTMNTRKCTYFEVIYIVYQELTLLPTSEYATLLEVSNINFKK